MIPKRPGRESLWRFYLMLGVLLLGFLAMMVHVYRSASRVGMVYAPLVDAAMEMRLEATTGYLWFEEALSGVPGLTMDEVWRHLDKADWYARAMLEGGKNSEGHYLPLEDAGLRKTTELARTRLGEVRDLLRQRHEQSEPSVVEEALDQRTHLLFQEFAAAADAVETSLQKRVAEELDLLRWILVALVVGGGLVTVWMGRLFRRFEQGRLEYFHELESARTRMAEGEERFRAIFEQAADSIVLIDAETGALVEFNDRACQSLGYSAEEFKRLEISDIEVIESPEEIRKHMELIIEQGADVFETRHRTRSGELRDIRVYSRVITLRQKQYFVSIWHDITEKNQAAKALRSARDQLEQRVADRTAELTLVNARLIREVEDRKAAEAALRESEDALRQLSAALMDAQEKERARIAVELHDGIGQSFTAIKFAVEAALGATGAQAGSEARGPLEAILPLIQETIDDLRRIGTDLRPSTLDDLGLKATISWYCGRFRKIYPAIRLEEQLPLDEAQIPGIIKTPAYRILQESLNNVARHSRASAAWVELDQVGDQLEMTIRDNGCGFDPSQVPQADPDGHHVGLRSMRERAEFSGGLFAVESHLGRGTLVRVRWPAPASDHSENAET